MAETFTARDIPMVGEDISAEVESFRTRVGQAVTRVMPFGLGRKAVYG